MSMLNDGESKLEKGCVTMNKVFDKEKGDCEYNAIQTINLSKRYGDFVAVDSINLEIKKGELFSILGPNGAGKTTTIKILSCLLLPTEGTAKIMGYDIKENPQLIKEIIDVSPQETAVAGHLNAWENLKLMGGIYGLGKEEIEKRACELLDLLDLPGREKEQVKKYSGGMKRRLSIAMAMMSDPQILFLDEPTLGLDPQARKTMWEKIEGLKGEKTIVLTTHYLEEADALADRIAILKEGKIIAIDTPDELKNNIKPMKSIVIKTKNISDDIVKGIKEMYSDVVFKANKIEIKAIKLNVDKIVDYLRLNEVKIEGIFMKEPSLDDVFFELTGERVNK